MKHRIKTVLRNLAARGGTALGLWRLVNRALRCGRITILALHCVGRPPETAYMPDYMKIPEEALDRLLGRLRGAFDIIDLPEALRRLEGGGRDRNALVLTLDDGYKDNRTRGLPLLARHGVPAVVFPEVGAVDRQGLGWIHKFFFVNHAKGIDAFAAEYARRTGDPAVSRRLAGAAARGGNLEYVVKRILKYEVDPVERDRIAHELFVAAGGDEEAILEAVYLDWKDVADLAGEGVTFGCHTVTHPILSALDRAEAKIEITEARRLLRARAGIETDLFAYPWGRAWDFNVETVTVLQEEGFRCGLTAEGRSVVPGRCDLFSLSRVPLATGFSSAALLAEATGIYDALHLS